MYPFTLKVIGIKLIRLLKTKTRLSMIFSLTLWDFARINNPLILLCVGGGCTGGGNPGVMREGSLREAGEEGDGGGISKAGGGGKKWENFRNIGKIFHSRKSTQRRELLWKGAGTGSVGCGGREDRTLLSPPPPP